MSEEIKNNQIPEEIKDICRSCEENIHCQNKGCAFRSLGNEYCDYVLNATKLYLDLQQKVEQLEKENKELNRMCELYSQSLYNADLTKAEKKVEQLENIRKEAIEYILKNKLYRFKYDDEELFEITTDKKAKDDLLNILDKGSDKE